MWDAGRRTEKFFPGMFRFQKAGSSKFSAGRFWLRTDRRLMPWRFWMDLGCGIRQAPFGDFGGLAEYRLCVPKSWVLSRKLRTSSFFPESHPREKFLRPADCGWFYVLIVVFRCAVENIEFAAFFYGDIAGKNYAVWQE